MQPGPIYAITDPALLPAHQLVAGVAAALRGGVRTVQYRDKTAGHAERLARAKALLQVCNDGAAALIINDDVELAAETGSSFVSVSWPVLTAFTCSPLHPNARAFTASARNARNFVTGTTPHSVARAPRFR